MNISAFSNQLIELRDAQSDDYREILQLNTEAVPNVNLIDADKLRELHEQAAALVVAQEKSSGRIAGFLLVITDGADYDSLNYQYFSANYSSFAYVDRIVVSPDHQRKGIGKLFYKYLFDLAADRPTTCEVNVEPPNEQSMAFHGQLGFTSVEEQATEGGTKRVALLVRPGDS